MGTVLGIAGWAAALLLAEITVSCLLRAAAARLGRGAAPDHALTLAGFSGSFLVAVLALASADPLLPALSAALVFAATAAPLANLVRLGARQGKPGIALRRIARMLRIMLQDARYLPARDLRALFGLFRRDAGPAIDPNGGYRPVPGGMRTVPSILKDVSIGPVPHPASVAADLERQGVMVPSVWGALAESEGTFDPDDEDDLLQRKAERAAGVLAWAESLQAQAEDLAVSKGLDPDFIAAEFEFADLAADLAAAAAMTVRRYHEVYEGVHEHRDSGRTLPRNADQFFGAEANPGDGSAA